jgi:DNA-binding MarR family transcriptional regulator
LDQESGTVKRYNCRMSNWEEDRPADAALDQAGQALFRLGRLFSRHPVKNQWRHNAAQSVELSHILVTEAVASASVERGQHVTVGVVAERLGIDPSTASRLVAETIEAGYLARLSSPLDKRRLCLELTDTGHELRVHAQAYQRAVFAHVTGDWTADEQHEFARLLVKFVASVADIYTQPDHVPHNLGKHRPEGENE